MRRWKRTRCHLLGWSRSCLKDHVGADGVWLDEQQMLVCCLALCKHLLLLVCSPLPNEGAFDVSEKQIILFMGFPLDNYPRNVLTIVTWNNNKVSTHNFFLSLLNARGSERKRMDLGQLSNRELVSWLSDNLHTEPSVPLCSPVPLSQGDWKWNATLLNLCSIVCHKTLIMLLHIF